MTHAIANKISRSGLFAWMDCNRPDGFPMGKYLLVPGMHAHFPIQSWQDVFDGAGAHRRGSSKKRIR